ncbi:hypothetical protein T552_00675 [Pneumocystis carinii B80]|uniref:YjeF N-terminal domain-containing protein n=1 Tax=Pneumocystis carinii (strain B80) TaxID=1408658 RepID=A0A0W4ZP97_PNEC8|nr:hypothetical protein T552_00675 [Pneumocystis carinii B80]KTW30197.1 hypothetical protein T552_00675 [Pneumocystis carinii B80]
MEKQFIGLKVEVILRNNTIVQGKMTNIDAVDRCLFLKNVYCKTTGKFVPEMKIEGIDIKDLNFISSFEVKKKKSFASIDPAIISISDDLSNMTTKESSKKSKKDTALASLSSRLHKNTKDYEFCNYRPKDSSNVHAYSMKNIHKRNRSYMNHLQKESLQFKHTNHDDWINEDVNRYRDEEFDFQGNLGRFDKHKVFSEIRKSNMISSTSLSASSNCLSKTELSSDVAATNLVMSKKRASLNENNRFLKMNGNENTPSTDFHSSTHLSSDSYDEEEVYQQKLKNQHSNNQQTLSNLDKISRKNKKIRNTKNNLECPCIKSSKMIEAEYISTFNIGVSNDAIVENAARGISFLVVQLLDDFLRFSQKKSISSSVIILAGNNQTGLYAIASGRQLCNHGVNVMIVVIEENPSKRILFYLKGFSNAGGKIVSSEELFRAIKSFSVFPGLIIDAIFGCHCSFNDIMDDSLRDRICSLIDWANQYQSDILSLDLPSGLDITTGAPLASPHFIQSKWILSLGLPKIGLLFALKSKSVPKELFLADIGIPQKVWKKVGIGKRAKSLWAGQDWVIKLDFS